MKIQRDHRTWKKERQQVPKNPSARKPYQSPRIERLGSLTAMTQGVGGGLLDGGVTSAY